MSNIEGIPEGWELVRVGKPLVGEFFIDGLSCPHQAMDDQHFHGCAIIRQIPKPKQYRAFANAAEFEPHRDRWVRRIANGGAFLISDYSWGGFCYDELSPVSWEELFNMGYVFDDDGSPFGVEVTS